MFLWDWFSGVLNFLGLWRKSGKLLFLGLDNAGKTTILYRLNLNETIVTMPTVGFNVERVKYKKIEFTVWDIGGQDCVRSLWKHYYAGTEGIIFVVDASDIERMDDAKEEVQHLFIQEELRNIPMLVFANKQDLPNALSAHELATRLGLTTKRNQDLWHVQSCCAKIGDGLYGGLDWLSSHTKKKNAQCHLNVYFFYYIIWYTNFLHEHCSVFFFFCRK
jgi:small GTP-binding protein